MITEMRISPIARREVDRLLIREIRVNSDSLVSEIISLRSTLCHDFPNDRGKIETAFSDLLNKAEEQSERIKRYEDRRSRGGI